MFILGNLILKEGFEEFINHHYFFSNSDISCLELEVSAIYNHPHLKLVASYFTLLQGYQEAFALIVLDFFS